MSLDFGSKECGVVHQMTQQRNHVCSKCGRELGASQLYNTLIYLNGVTPHARRLYNVNQHCPERIPIYYSNPLFSPISPSSYLMNKKKKKKKKDNAPLSVVSLDYNRNPDRYYEKSQVIPYSSHLKAKNLDDLIMGHSNPPRHGHSRHPNIQPVHLLEKTLEKEYLDYEYMQFLKHIFSEKCHTCAMPHKVPHVLSFRINTEDNTLCPYVDCPGFYHDRHKNPRQSIRRLRSIPTNHAFPYADEPIRPGHMQLCLPLDDSPRFSPCPPQSPRLLYFPSNDSIYPDVLVTSSPSLVPPDNEVSQERQRTLVNHRTPLKKKQEFEDFHDRLPISSQVSGSKTPQEKRDGQASAPMSVIPRYKESVNLTGRDGKKGTSSCKTSLPNTLINRFMAHLSPIYRLLDEYYRTYELQHEQRTTVNQIYALLCCVKDIICNEGGKMFPNAFLSPFRYHNTSPQDLSTLMFSKRVSDSLRHHFTHHLNDENLMTQVFSVAMPTCQDDTGEKRKIDHTGENAKESSSSDNKAGYSLNNHALHTGPLLGSFPSPSHHSLSSSSSSHKSENSFTASLGSINETKASELNDFFHPKTLNDCSSGNRPCFLCREIVQQINRNEIHTPLFNSSQRKSVWCRQKTVILYLKDERILDRRESTTSPPHTHPPMVEEDYVHSAPHTKLKVLDLALLFSCLPKDTDSQDFRSLVHTEMGDPSFWGAIPQELPPHGVLNSSRVTSFHQKHSHRHSMSNALSHPPASYLPHDTVTATKTLTEKHVAPRAFQRQRSEPNENKKASEHCDSIFLDSSPSIPQTFIDGSSDLVLDDTRERIHSEEGDGIPLETFSPRSGQMESQALNQTSVKHYSVPHKGSVTSQPSSCSETVNMSKPKRLSESRLSNASSIDGEDLHGETDVLRVKKFPVSLKKHLHNNPQGFMASSGATNKDHNPKRPQTKQYGSDVVPPYKKLFSKHKSYDVKGHTIFNVKKIAKGDFGSSDDGRVKKTFSAAVKLQPNYSKRGDAALTFKEERDRRFEKFYDAKWRNISGQLVSVISKKRGLPKEKNSTPETSFGKKIPSPRPGYRLIKKVPQLTETGLVKQKLINSPLQKPPSVVSSNPHNLKPFPPSWESQKRLALPTKKSSQVMMPTTPFSYHPSDVLKEKRNFAFRLPPFQSHVTKKMFDSKKYPAPLSRMVNAHTTKVMSDGRHVPSIISKADPGKVMPVNTTALHFKKIKYSNRGGFQDPKYPLKKSVVRDAWQAKWNMNKLNGLKAKASTIKMKHGIKGNPLKVDPSKVPYVDLLQMDERSAEGSDALNNLKNPPSELSFSSLLSGVNSEKEEEKEEGEYSLTKATTPETLPNEDRDDKTTSFYDDHDEAPESDEKAYSHDSSRERQLIAIEREKFIKLLQGALHHRDLNRIKEYVFELEDLVEEMRKQIDSYKAMIEKEKELRLLALNEKQKLEEEKGQWEETEKKLRQLLDLKTQQITSSLEKCNLLESNVDEMEDRLELLVQKFREKQRQNRDSQKALDEKDMDFKNCDLEKKVLQKKLDTLKTKVDKSTTLLNRADVLLTYRSCLLEEVTKRLKKKIEENEMSTQRKEFFKKMIYKVYHRFQNLNYLKSHDKRFLEEVIATLQDEKDTSLNEDDSKVTSSS